MKGLKKLWSIVVVERISSGLNKLEAWLQAVWCGITSGIESCWIPIPVIRRVVVIYHACEAICVRVKRYLRPIIAVLLYDVLTICYGLFVTWPPWGICQSIIANKAFNFFLGHTIMRTHKKLSKKVPIGMPCGNICNNIIRRINWGHATPAFGSIFWTRKDDLRHIVINNWIACFWIPKATNHWVYIEVGDFGYSVILKCIKRNAYETTLSFRIDTGNIFCCRNSINVRPSSRISIWRVHSILFCQWIDIIATCFRWKSQEYLLEIVGFCIHLLDRFRRIVLVLWWCVTALHNRFRWWINWACLIWSLPCEGNEQTE